MSFVFKRGSIPSSVEVDRDSSCSSCSSYFGVVYELLGLRAASSKLAYVCVELSEHSGS